jgi:hypothetical protein
MMMRIDIGLGIVVIAYLAVSQYLQSTRTNIQALTLFD